MPDNRSPTAKLIVSANCFMTGTAKEIDLSVVGFEGCGNRKSAAAGDSLIVWLSSEIIFMPWFLMPTDTEQQKTTSGFGIL